MLEWIDRLFNKHKFVRRSMVLWAVWMNTLLILFYVEQKASGTNFDGHDVAVITLFSGLLMTAITFYKWSRDRDDHQ